VAVATFPTWPRLVGLTAASSGLMAAALLHPPVLVVAGMGAAGWTVHGWLRHGLSGALAASLPALALTGGWASLAAWSIAGLASGLAARSTANREALWSARDAVRDAEREQRELQRHNERYPALLEACLAFSSARDHDQLAEILVIAVVELVDQLDCVRVYLGPAGQPACLASRDAEGQPCPVPASADEQYVATEARPLIRREGAWMHAALPLRGDRRRDEDGDSLRGVLTVRFRLDDLGDRLALELLSALSRLAGIGLATVDLLTQARSLALRDSLTGLYGRQEFLRRLDEHAASAQRNRTSLGVIMCDLDRLKAYNDRYGHPAGDTALTLVARSLGEVLSGDAIVCRYGGEEFVALIPGVDRDAIALRCEQVRAAIAATELVPNDGKRRVTASLGWALLAPDEDIRACLARADQAAYAAKAAGRNCVKAAP